MPRKKQHYVDNSKLLEVMSEYREQYLIAKDNDMEPVIPDYAGECFEKLQRNYHIDQTLSTMHFVKKW